MKHLSEWNFSSVTNTTKLKLNILKKFNMLLPWYAFTFIKSHCQRFVLIKCWPENDFLLFCLLHIWCTYMWYMYVWYVCAHTHVWVFLTLCVCEWVYVCACMRISQRLLSSIFFSCSPTSFLKQGLSLNLKPS